MTEILQTPGCPQPPAASRSTTRGKPSQLTARPPLKGGGGGDSCDDRHSANSPLPGSSPTSFQFTVPGRPVSWKRTKGGKVGQRYTPTKQRIAQKRIEIQARAAIPNGWSSSGRFIVNIAAAFKWPFLETRSSEPDSDNIAKLVNEALEGVAFLNDRQATTVIVEKRYQQAAEWLDVRVTRGG